MIRKPVVPSSTRCSRGARRDQPLLLVVAGTPDAPRRLRECGTFLERAFVRFRIGRLQREATLAALAEPARTAGRPMRAEAQAVLADASQDYPYLIQLLGSAAWDAAAATNASAIGAPEARAGLGVARHRITDFYAERLAELRERRAHCPLRALAALVISRGGVIGDDDLDGFLERAAADEAHPIAPETLQRTLRELGVLWEASPGAWEMGIPNFARYLLDRAAGRPAGRVRAGRNEIRRR